MADDIHTYEMGYSGELSGDMLAQGLGDLTGYDFSASIRFQAGGFYVDWSADSSLITTPAELPASEEFALFDVDSVRWFMLDSMYATLVENFGDHPVYYSMQGGHDLLLEALYPVQVFPTDTEYMRSPFYFAHADVNGGE